LTHPEQLDADLFDPVKNPKKAATYFRETYVNRGFTDKLWKKVFFEIHVFLPKGWGMLEGETRRKLGKGGITIYSGQPQFQTVHDMGYIVLSHPNADLPRLAEKLAAETGVPMCITSKPILIPKKSRTEGEPRVLAAHISIDKRQPESARRIVKEAISPRSERGPVHGLPMPLQLVPPLYRLYDPDALEKALSTVKMQAQFVADIRAVPLPQTFIRNINERIPQGKGLPPCPLTMRDLILLLMNPETKEQLFIGVDQQREKADPWLTYQPKNEVAVRRFLGGPHITLLNKLREHVPSQAAFFNKAFTVRAKETSRGLVWNEESGTFKSQDEEDAVRAAQDLGAFSTDNLVAKLHQVDLSYLDEEQEHFDPTQLESIGTFSDNSMLRRSKDSIDEAAFTHKINDQPESDTISEMSDMIEDDEISLKSNNDYDDNTYEDNSNNNNTAMSGSQRDFDSTLQNNHLSTGATVPGTNPSGNYNSGEGSGGLSTTGSDAGTFAEAGANQ